MASTRTRHRNSLSAYQSQRQRFGARQQAILAVFAANGPLTDREVAEKMGGKHRSYVQPRISELLADGFLIETGHTKDAVTDITVRLCTVLLASPPPQPVHIDDTDDRQMALL